MDYPNSNHDAPVEEASDSTFLSEQQIAERGVPAAVQQLRDADVARQMYGSAIQAERAAEVAKLVPPRDGQGNQITDEAKQQYAHFLAGWSQDAELTAAEFRELIALPGARSVEEMHGWEREALDELKRMPGGEAAVQQRISEANRLLALDPRLKSWAMSTGLASHPKFVVLLAEKARTLIVAGKL